MAKATNANREQYWQGVLERQKASGQSIVRFCAKEGLSPASFHAWKRRLRRGARKAERKAAIEALVPVQIVSDQVGGAGNLEVQWPGGVSLRIRGCDVQTVGAVVTALPVGTTRRSRRC